ncbi:condensation domain-containing protein [Roseivirga sp. BDSF3-8]|uniref:condensation domain-containing protein n=1 Tax=Roseivirga sp. BDSF3-8 TaxID=3241598 RepID=UPI003531BAB3
MSHFSKAEVTLTNQADLSVLEEAFNDLVLQHDGLRLNVHTETNGLYINNSHLQQRAVVDKFVLEQGETVAKVKEHLLSRFDLSTSLMISMTYIQQAGQPDRLLLMAHHLVVDGISWRIILQDLQDACQARKEGRVPTFPKTASLKDWSAALADYTLTPEEEAYWQNQTVAAPIPMQTDNPDAAMAHQKSHTVALDAEDTSYLLQEAHAAYNTDVPVLLNTALALTLKEWTGADEFTVEHENHGRHLEEVNTSRTVGWFTAMYPVTLSLKGDDTGSHIKGIKEQLRQVPNHGLGYGVGRYLSDDPLPAHNPAIRFNYLGQLDVTSGNDLFSYENQELALDSAPENHMSTWLEWNSIVTDGQLTVTLIYNEQAHDAATADKLAAGFIEHLKALLRHLREEDDIHFTPSDFAGASLDEEDLDALFG